MHGSKQPNRNYPPSGPSRSRLTSAAERTPLPTTLAAARQRQPLGPSLTPPAALLHSQVHPARPVPARKRGSNKGLYFKTEVPCVASVRSGSINNHNRIRC